MGVQKLTRAEAVCFAQPTESYPFFTNSLPFDESGCSRRLSRVTDMKFSTSSRLIPDSHDPSSRS